MQGWRHEEMKKKGDAGMKERRGEGLEGCGDQGYRDDGKQG